MFYFDKLWKRLTKSSFKKYQGREEFYIGKRLAEGNRKKILHPHYIPTNRREPIRNYTNPPHPYNRNFKSRANASKVANKLAPQKQLNFISNNNQRSNPYHTKRNLDERKTDSAVNDSFQEKTDKNNVCNIYPMAPKKMNSQKQEDKIKSMEIISKEMSQDVELVSDSTISQTITSDVVIKEEYRTLNSSISLQEKDMEDQYMKALNSSLKKIKSTSMLNQVQSCGEEIWDGSENKFERNGYSTLKATKCEDKVTMTELWQAKSAYVQTEANHSRKALELKQRFFEELKVKVEPKGKMKPQPLVSAPDQFKFIHVTKGETLNPLSQHQTSVSEKHFQKMKKGKILRSKSKPEGMNKVALIKANLENSGIQKIALAGGSYKKNSNFSVTNSLPNSSRLKEENHEDIKKLNKRNSFTKIYDNRPIKRQSHEDPPVLRTKRWLEKSDQMLSSISSEISPGLVSVSTVKSSSRVSSHRLSSSMSVGAELSRESLRKSMERIPGSQGWGSREAVMTLYKNSPKMAALLGMFAEL